MTEHTLTPCVALRKDGRPCRAIGRVFDPDRNSLVCDAHQPGGPGRESLKLARREIALQQLAEAKAEVARRRDAIAVGLSDDGLRTLLNDLRKFREGQPLRAKVRKLLEDILVEHHRGRDWRLVQKKLAHGGPED